MEASTHARHTPCPWSILPAATDDDWPAVQGTSRGATATVCHVEEWAAPGNAEAAANARLLAAAPELLAACQTMLQHCQGLAPILAGARDAGEGLGRHTTANLADCVARDAQRLGLVIARATGRGC